MDHERVRAQERLLKSRNPGEVMTEAENRVAGRKAGLCTRRRLSAGASEVARLERCHALAPDRCAVAGRQRGRPHSAVAKSRTMGRLVGESSAEGFRGVPHPQTLKRNQEKGERERALGPRRSDRARKPPAEADTARRADAVPTGPTQTWAWEGTWSSLAQDPVVARSEHRRHHTAAPSASARASLRAKLQPRGT